MISLKLFMTGQLFLAGVKVFTGGVVGGTLLTIAILIGVTLAVKTYLNSKAQQLPTKYDESPESQSPLVRKYDEVQTEQHRSSFFFAGSVASLVVTFLVLNWTTFTKEVKAAEQEIVIAEDIAIEPPPTPPLHRHHRHHHHRRHHQLLCLPKW